MKTAFPSGPTLASSVTRPPVGLRTHGLILLGIIIIAALVYIPLARANFCGFDDTLDLQRLTFHDPGNVMNDLTSVLYGSGKYRPFLTTLNRLTLQFGHESAAWFRFRNILAHLLVSMTIYGIGFLMYDSIPIAAASAFLFSLHPLVNQAVTGGMWVITPADSCLFLSFFLFQLSLRPGRWSIPALVGALVVGP